MNKNEINARAKFGNNIVQVTSTNIHEAERQAESFAQKAEQSKIECANYLATIQNILAMCNSIKDNLETLIYDDFGEHTDDFNNPHRVSAEQVNSYTKSETDTLLSGKQPVGNYLTEHQSLSNYYTKTESDNKYLTSHQDISGKANSADLSAVATSGDYDDLLNKPTIPAAQIQSDWSQSDNTAADYIKNKPVIPDAQVQANWNESDTTSKAYIQNKPTIPDAQIQSNWSQSNSNAKDYIKNKPTIGNGTITIKQGGNYKGSFSTNQTGATTINLDGGSNMQVDSSLDLYSSNPVENGVITATLDNFKQELINKQNKLTAGDGISLGGIDLNNSTIVHPNLNTTQWHDIKYIDGKYIAVGEWGSVATSTDGASWTMVRETGNTLMSVARSSDNGMFVAVGENSTFVSSGDFQTWSEQQVGTDIRWRRIVYGNNTFIAAGEYFDHGAGTMSGYIAVGDGINQWSVSQVSNDSLTDIIFDGTKFVAVGGGSSVGCSYNGFTWSWSTFDPNPMITQSITYGDGNYVVIADTNVYVSRNLITWSSIYDQRFQDVIIEDSAYVNGTYMFVGNNIMNQDKYLYTTTDLTNMSVWNTNSLSTQGFVYCIEYDGDNLLLGCEWGEIVLYCGGSTISYPDADKMAYLFEVTEPIKLIESTQYAPDKRTLSFSLCWLDSAIKDLTGFNCKIEPEFGYYYKRMSVDAQGMGYDGNYWIIVADNNGNTEIVNASIDLTQGEYIRYVPTGVEGNHTPNLISASQQDQWTIAKCGYQYDMNLQDWVVTAIEIYKGLGKS